MANIVGIVRKNIKKIFSLSVLLSCGLFCSAEESLYLVHGYEAYRCADWTSASFFLRNAVCEKENSTDSVWYMLIMSQMNSKNFSNAISDCDYFLKNFNDSFLRSSVEYQKGRALHEVGQNDKAVLVLSNFCHENPESSVYSSALFWIAECFFSDYDYETARSLYERIVADYPNGQHVEDAKLKLYLIRQKEREQKLLYLLRMTGEEYLSTCENYEKQLRIYHADDGKERRKMMAEPKENVLDDESLKAGSSESGFSKRADSAKQVGSANIASPAKQVSDEKKVSAEKMEMLEKKANLVKELLEKSVGEYQQ